MVAPMKNLNQHSIFDALRQNKDRLKPLNESKRLLALKEGELFVWDNYRTCVFTTNLKSWSWKNETHASHQVRTKTRKI